MDIQKVSNSMIGLSSGENLTMSSREIAALTDKEHAHVVRDINAMVKQYRKEMNLSELGKWEDPEGFKTISREYNGRKVVDEVILNKDWTLTLISGYRVSLRKKIISRWQELEAERLPMLTLPDFNNPAEAARAWADQFEHRQIAEKELETARPKAQAYDRIAAIDGMLSVTEIANKVGVSASLINEMLEELNVYNQKIKRSRLFKKWFIDAGYGVSRKDANGTNTPMFTNAGELWVIERLYSEGII